MVQPTLKWAGGKRQLLDSLHELLPDTYGRYWEPFVGGGALAFDLEPDAGVINDINTRLMNYYRVVKHEPEQLIEILEEFPDPESDPDDTLQFANSSHFGYDINNYYYQARARFNKRPYGYEFDDVEEAALLQYLNRTCFNGLYRENQSGGFNTPIGDYEDPDWVQAERIRDLSDVLATVELYSNHYQAVLSGVQPGDLVYIDPPYTPLSETADFTEYSADGFDSDDQLTLRETLTQLVDIGVHVVASNSGVMKSQYRDAGFDVYTVDATRSINADADGRGAVDEIIAVGRP